VARIWAIGILVLLTAAASISVSAQPASKLIVYGDMTIFLGPGHERNCALTSRYKRGEPVGWRMFVADPETGELERSAELVVHLNYGGKILDIPMRYRATEKQPERKFWVAKWVVPNDAPTGIVRYTVSAKDKRGRTGVFTPFDVDTSQLTIVE
jgi:hypothetical protein